MHQIILSIWKLFDFIIHQDLILIDESYYANYKDRYSTACCDLFPYINTTLCETVVIVYGLAIDHFHKSQNAPVPYPRIRHSEQKCAHFCSEWSILGYGTGAFWDLWIRSIGAIAEISYIHLLWEKCQKYNFQTCYAVK